VTERSARRQLLTSLRAGHVGRRRQFPRNSLTRPLASLLKAPQHHADRRPPSTLLLLLLRAASDDDDFSRHHQLSAASSTLGLIPRDVVSARSIPCSHMMFV